MIPPVSLQTLANIYVGLEADARGISADSLTTQDLQALAYGLRLAAHEIDDKDSSSELLKVANAIDGLADLTPTDLAYLEAVPAAHLDPQQPSAV